MPIVIDASITGAISLPDEAMPGDALMESLSTKPLIVPPHWWLEVANLIQMAVRRGRLAEPDRAAALGRAGILPVTTDDGSVAYAWTHTVNLADTYGLTVYDAAYLELALRRDAQLATYDRRLMTAARAAGVVVIE